MIINMLFLNLKSTNLNTLLVMCTIYISSLMSSPVIKFRTLFLYVTTHIHKILRHVYSQDSYIIASYIHRLRNWHIRTLHTRPVRVSSREEWLQLYSKQWETHCKWQWYRLNWVFYTPKTIAYKLSILNL